MATTTLKVEDSKILSKVSNYATVSSLIESTMGYYYWGREASPMIAYAESKLEGSLKWIAPKVEPILLTETYKTYAKPLLTRVDDLGATTLDSVEIQVEKIKTNLNSRKDTIEKTVTSVRDAASGAIEGVQQKIVVPIDSYLKDSVIGKPLNLALDVTEKVIDRYLPEEETEEQEGDQSEIKKEETSGPVIRSARLSKRAQKQAFAKLHNLSFRPQGQPLQYTVDLIQYAAQTLDKGVNSVKNTVHKGVETVNHETPKVRERIGVVTQHAVTALHTAVETILHQIPAPVTSKVQLLHKEAQNFEFNAHLFTTVAQASVNLLHEASSTLSEYTVKGEQIPKQILQATLEKIHQVAQSLFPFTKKNNEDTEQKTTAAKETEEEN